MGHIAHLRTSSIQTTMFIKGGEKIPITQGCFVQSLVDIGFVVLKKLNFVNVFSLFPY